MSENLPSKVTCAEHALKIAHLEEWQNKQNGMLDKLREEIKSFHKDLNTEIRTLKVWIMTLMGSIILMLVANLLLGR